MTTRNVSAHVCPVFIHLFHIVVTCMVICPIGIAIDNRLYVPIRAQYTLFLHHSYRLHVLYKYLYRSITAHQHSVGFYIRYVYAIIMCGCQSRIQKFCRGRRITVYQARHHLSHMHTTNCALYTKKGDLLKKNYEQIGAASLWIRHWRRPVIYKRATKITIYNSNTTV